MSPHSHGEREAEEAARLAAEAEARRVEPEPVKPPKAKRTAKPKR